MRAIFLDRDGVINRYPGDRDYVKSWSEFRFVANVKCALKKLHGNGFKIFIVSNQAGVSKGIYTQKDLDFINQNMLKSLGDYIAGVYYCTHRNEDNCACRKPKTGLIEMAVNELKAKGEDVELAKSYFIGDSIRDVQTGKSAGLKTILVFSGKEKPQNRDTWQVLPDFTANDLSEAAELVLKHNPS
jgi:histidinol-phosphate phosphatase family protein